MQTSTSSPFFTIVVPCFNAAHFILDCLSSVFANEFSDFEIVLIDDGSTDESAKLVASFFAHEIAQGRLSIISQPNAGLSAARNRGIAAASGGHLIFLDADDILHRETLSRLKSAFEGETEIVEFGHLRFIDKQEPLWPHLEPTAGVVSTRESAFRDASWYACFRAYKRSSFEQIQFPIGRHYEDAMTIPFLYLRAQRIVRLTEPLYAYRINPAGITQRLRPAYARDLAEYFCWLLPLDGRFLATHKLGTLRLMKELGLMMQDSTLNTFIRLARNQLPKNAAADSGWLDSLFWKYPWAFNAYIKLRTLRNRWRRR